MAKLSEKDFIRNGYAKFEEKIIGKQFASFLLQKRVNDKKGATKYFIDVWFYDNDFEVELTLEKRHYVVKVLVYSIDDDYFDLLELLENEIERIWKALGSPYYRG